MFIGSPVLHSDEFRLEWLLYNIIVATYAWGIAMYSTAFPYYLLENEKSESSLDNATPNPKNNNNNINHKTVTVVTMKQRLIEVISNETAFHLFMHHLMRSGFVCFVFCFCLSVVFVCYFLILLFCCVRSKNGFVSFFFCFFFCFLFFLYTCVRVHIAQKKNFNHKHK